MALGCLYRHYIDYDEEENSEICEETVNNDDVVEVNQKENDCVYDVCCGCATDVYDRWNEKNDGDGHLVKVIDDGGDDHQLKGNDDDVLQEKESDDDVLQQMMNDDAEKEMHDLVKAKLNVLFPEILKQNEKK